MSNQEIREILTYINQYCDHADDDRCDCNYCSLNKAKEAISQLSAQGEREPIPQGYERIEQGVIQLNDIMRRNDGELVTVTEDHILLNKRIHFEEKVYRKRIVTTERYSVEPTPTEELLSEEAKASAYKEVGEFLTNHRNRHGFLLPPKLSWIQSLLEGKMPE